MFDIKFESSLVTLHLTVRNAISVEHYNWIRIPISPLCICEFLMICHFIYQQNKIK
jgi:hypothetical protein